MAEIKTISLGKMKHVIKLKKNMNERLEAIAKGFGTILPKSDVRKALDYAIQVYEQDGPKYLTRLVASPLPKEIIKDYAPKVFSMPKIRRIKGLENHLETIERIRKVKKYLPQKIVRGYLINTLRYFSYNDEINWIESYEINIESLSNIFNWLRKLNGKTGTKEFKDKLKEMVDCKKEIEELREESKDYLYSLLRDVRKYFNKPEIYGGEKQIGNLPSGIEKKVENLINDIDFYFDGGRVLLKKLNSKKVIQIDSIFDRFGYGGSCMMKYRCEKAKELISQKNQLLLRLRILIGKETKRQQNNLQSLKK